jgi:hypothetical protein
VTGRVKPLYYILTVVYAPPGTQGGGTSSVSYGSGSSTGTTASTSNTFKQGYSISATTTLGNSLSIGGSFGYARNTSNTQALDIKKTENSTIAQKGPPADGIDHDRDIIYLWLNPLVNVSVSKSDKSVSWTFDDTTTAEIQFLFVGQLKDPTKISPGVLQALQRNGITPNDFQDIMNADPFADGSTPVESERFVSLHTTFPYEPPFARGDPVPTFTYALNNSTASTVGNSSSEDYQVGLTVGGDTNFLEIYKASVKTSSSWTWSSSNAEGATTGTTQSASVTVGGPSFGYTGPTDIAVYYDVLYQTFAFAPVQGVLKKLHGVVAKTGKPAAGQEVIAVVGGVKYRTFTNAAGEYHFFDRMSGPVELHAGDVNQQLPDAQTSRSIDLSLH